ncbi:nucleic acid/nucleotide deaminase domain-containing protein [Streptomyces sp. NPDC053427]|uniref:nucleic acid/nucleotide deaminase domain-containing protein n=1 Tax=Streptomyces sp. NPDC053427 TaxID=3365701 RepID=UPI0037D8E8AA
MAAAIAPLPAETQPPAYALPAAEPKPPVPDEWGQIPLYDHPISQIGYERRVEAGMATPGDDRALNRNAAVGFVDMSSEVAEALRAEDPEKELEALSEKYGGYKIRQAADDPDLFASLGLDPGVTALLVVPKLNNQSTRHSEMELLWTLRRKGIAWDRLLALWTERSPCTGKPDSCFPQLRKLAPHIRIFLSEVHQTWANGDSKTIREAINRGLETELRRKKEKRSVQDPKIRSTVDSAFTPGTVSECQTSGLGAPRAGRSLALMAAPSPYGGSLRSAARPCGEDDTESGSQGRQPSVLAKMLAMPQSDPGGIDFSSLNLRYLADSGSAKTGLRYSMGAAPVAPGGENLRSDGVKAVREASDAFFVWLSLRPSAFWVNLNPNEPERIVDRAFGRTDAGRILLQADLRMKKTIAQLIHPDTELGAAYWDRIQGTCMSMRTWIVPGEAKVHATPDELYIMDAPLKVKMETQYLQGRGAAGTKACAQQERSVEEHNESLFRDMILPKVEEAVNTAPEYAELRRVYLSRVAAEWYRDVSRRKNATYAKLIDRGDVGQWATTSDWKPRDTFDDYVDSYKKGEFKVTRRTTEGNVVYLQTYAFGGVDLTHVPFRKVDDGRFTAEWPNASTNVDRSWDRPVRGADGSERTLLLSGGPSPAEARNAADGSFSWTEFVDSVPFRWALLGAVVVTFLVTRWRLRRRT